MKLTTLFNKTSLVIASIAIITLTSNITLAHNHSAETSKVSFETTELSPNLYMLSGVGGFTGGNIALSVGDDGVIMIDNGLSKFYDLLKEEIKATTDRPIDYLINTHLHQDHTANNLGFGKDGAQIISHDNVREAFVKEKNDNGSLPVITFADQMTIHINSDTAKIIHAENAHTNGDSIIHFQNANVIHTGDLLFNGRFPFIDGNNGGTLAGVLAGLNTVLSLANDETKIIPGHGPLANKADIIKTIAFLEDARDLIADLVKQGKTDEEIHAANPLSKYESYSWGFINTEKMINQVISNVR